MPIPPSFICILSARPFGRSTLAEAQRYLYIRPVQTKKAFRFDCQCDAHAHQSRPSLLLVIMLRRTRIVNNAQFRHKMAARIAAIPFDIAVFTGAGAVDNGTVAKPETAKASGPTVDDFKIPMPGIDA